VVTPGKFFLCRGSSVAAAHGSILNQVFRSIQGFQHRLESLRVIAFAFFLDGSISEPAD